MMQRAQVGKREESGEMVGKHDEKKEGSVRACNGNRCPMGLNQRSMSMKRTRLLKMKRL